MVGALILLVLPGVFYNNYVNSDLVVHDASFTLNCPGLPDTTCQSSAATGCAAASSVCTLSGSSVSFLSGTSPFTALLTGNIGGLFSSLSAGTQAKSHGPFDVWGGTAYLTANCIVYGSAGNTQLSLFNWTFLRCTQANADGSNATSATSWNNWNTNFNTSTPLALAFFQLDALAVGGATFNCNELGQLNYTQGIGGSVVGGYTWYGCDVHTQSAAGGCAALFPPSVACLRSNFYWSFIIGVPFSQGVLGAVGRYTCSAVAKPCWHVNVPLLLAGFETGECFVTQGANRQIYSYLVSPQCDQWYSNVQAQTGANGVVFGLLGVFVTFLFGLALFLIGTGINIQGQGSIFGSGTGFSLGSNPQGSKLAQVVGLGLVLWAFLFSEFSSWYTSGFMPYGLDGTFGIISIAVTGSFWFGLYSWATSGQSSD